ncbi:unnamed protein product [Parnassius apollo]|uniref:(apollo) hypothetical protein n=1 Tax=Parnassius apollo TaxID=110799 RepID=A0A8S3XHV4_PARAO|nr:unnamed protein product [Parnassius apollo]
MPCKLTIDTGASRTVVSSQLIRQFLGDSAYNRERINLVTATGQRIPVRGEKEMELKLGGNLIYLHNVIVADIMDDCILGLDFMRNNCCEIDVKQGVLKCGQEELFMEGALPGNVYSIKKIVLPPRSETIVPVSLPRKPGRAHRCVLVERVNNDLPWKVARTLVRTTDILEVHVLNLCDQEQIKEKGTLVGTCEEVDWLRRCQYLSSGTPSKGSQTRVTTLLEDCRSVLSPNEMVKAKKLLLKYADVFSSNDADIGKTGLVQHKINTGEELPSLPPPSAAKKIAGST